MSSNKKPLEVGTEEEGEEGEETGNEKVLTEYKSLANGLALSLGYLAAVWYASSFTCLPTKEAASPIFIGVLTYFAVILVLGYIGKKTNIWILQ